MALKNEKANKLLTGNATTMMTSTTTTTLYVRSRRLINHIWLSLSAVS
jgi:hypothetical protein